MKTRENVKILLLQYRTSAVIRKEELEGVLGSSGLNSDQITAVYLLEEELDVNSITEYDGVIFAGTGEFSVFELKEKHPKAYETVEKALHYCKENLVPTMVICMQFGALFLGGKVTTDKEKAETGTILVKLNKKNTKNDVLFHDVPDEFYACMGHKEYASELPPNAVVLAYTDLCPTHAYRIGKNIICLQFHPELNKERTIKRIKMYPTYAGLTEEDLKLPEAEMNKVLDQKIEEMGLKDTPECTRILSKWVDREVLR